MKKLLFICVLQVFCLSLWAQGEVKVITSGGIQIIDNNEKRQAPTRIVFWTNTLSQGTIKVYFNGHYAGQITSRYTSAPNCGASGCVTVNVSGTGNTWYGIASDGTRWESSQAHLVAGCNSIRLYSTGSRPSGSTRSNSNTQSGSGSNNTSNSNSESRKSSSSSSGDSWEEVGRRVGDVMGKKLILVTNGNGWSAETHQINISTGYGPTYGDIGLKMYYDSPVLVGIGGGIGLNPKYSENSFDNKRIHWSGFLRLQFSKFVNMEIFAASHYFKDLDNTEVGLGAYLNYQHKIYKRLGISGGAGFILGNLSESEDKIKGEFSWNIGLTFNLYEE